MPRPSIVDIRSVGDFATTINWNLTMLSPPKRVKVPSAHQINIRCESIDVPKSTGTSTEVMIRGHKVKQPGLYTPSGTIILTAVETVDNMISNFYRSWREACYQSKTGRQYPKADVEATIRIERHDRDDKPIWFYELVGCYLEDYDAGGQLQSASADVVKPTLTISYDFFTDGSM